VIGTAIDATEIVPRIYQGAMPPYGSAVSDAGFSLLLCAALPYEYQPGAADKQHYLGQVRVLHLPADDNPFRVSDAEIEQAVRGATEAARYARAGHKVLITCRMGRNRSGFLTALTLRLLTGMPIETAIARVRARRPTSLQNPAMLEVLRRLAPTLKPVR
jgi:protein-tyrosine phosphatase